MTNNCSVFLFLNQKCEKSFAMYLTMLYLCIENNNNLAHKTMLTDPLKPKLTDPIMSIIETAFMQYRHTLVRYVNARVEDYDLAEDIVQDAFVRVLEMAVGVHEASVKSLLFTTCRNLVFDHLRRRLMAQRFASCMDCASWVEETTEQAVRVREIAEQEMRVVCSMPEKRAKVYRLSRYEGRGIDEIADALNISPRTVEAHLFAGRKEVREKLKVFAS